MLAMTYVCWAATSFDICSDIGVTPQQIEEKKFFVAPLPQQVEIFLQSLGCLVLWSCYRD